MGATFRMEVLASSLPSFSDGSEDMGEHRLLGEQRDEAFHQGAQPGLRHGRDQVAEAERRPAWARWPRTAAQRPAVRETGVQRAEPSGRVFWLRCGIHLGAFIAMMAVAEKLSAAAVRRWTPGSNWVTASRSLNRASPCPFFPPSPQIGFISLRRIRSVIGMTEVR